MPFSWFFRKKAKPPESLPKAAPTVAGSPRTPHPVIPTRQRSASVLQELKLLSLDVGGQLGDDARAKLQAVRLNPSEGYEALKLLGAGSDGDGQVHEQLLSHVVATVRPGFGNKGEAGPASVADIKWIIRRVELPAWFGDFAEAELVAGFSPDSYSHIPQTISRYLDLALPLVERSDGWWIIGGEGQTWQEVYDAWLAAAQAVEHVKAAKQRHNGTPVEPYPPLPNRQLRPALHVVVDEPGTPMDMLQSALRGSSLASHDLKPSTILSRRSKLAFGLVEGPMYRPFSPTSTPTHKQRLPRSVSASSNTATESEDRAWTDFAQSGFGDVAAEAKPDALSLNKRGIVEIDDSFVDFFNDAANDLSIRVQWPAFAVFELEESPAKSIGAELLLVSCQPRSPSASVSSRSPSVRLDSFKRSNNRRASLFGALTRSPSTLFGKRQGIREEKTDDASTRALHVPTPTDELSVASMSIDSRPIDDTRRERSLAPSPSPRPSHATLGPPIELTAVEDQPPSKISPHSPANLPLPKSLPPHAIDSPEPTSPNGDAKSDHTFGHD